MANLRKKGISFLKIIFSAVLLYFIFTKIQLQDVYLILKKTNPLFLFLALLLFAISKAIAAFRLNLYFHQLGVYLTHWSNTKLYLLGMFYNLFLPGGIGGDAYKGYIIKKSFNVETKKVIAVLVLDRLSGLLLLFLYACILAIKLNAPEIIPFKWLVGISMLLSVLIFWGLNKKFFKDMIPIFWRSLGYSAFVQAAQLGCLFFILKSLHIETSFTTYMFIFLISSIVAVLPLTIGGIGSREVIFFYGALWLNLNENTSVGISMVFFIITALVSLFGLIYHFNKPNLVLDRN